MSQISEPINQLPKPSILEKLMNPEYDGLHLLYSQFRTLEGIGIFSMVLNNIFNSYLK